MLPCKNCITLAMCKNSISNPIELIRRIDTCEIILEYLGNPTVNRVWLEWPTGTATSEDIESKFNEMHETLKYEPQINLRWKRTLGSTMQGC